MNKLILKSKKLKDWKKKKKKGFDTEILLKNTDCKKKRKRN